MAGATHEDGFHEIQLNGKQLVFLFMAVTVVSVVIFLCGVLVGRGVRLNGGETLTAELPETGFVDAPPVVDATVNSETPSTPDVNTTFGTALEAKTAPAPTLKPEEPPAPKAEPVAEPATPAPAPEPASSAPTATRAEAAAKPDPPAAVEKAAPTEPNGPGVAVQVAAFRVRADADALANRLIGKDYTAYVVLPAAGAPPVYRVRVGKFKEQRDADRVAARLKQEEKFDPWIVR